MHASAFAQAPVWFLVIVILLGIIVNAILLGAVAYFLKDLKRRFEEDLNRSNKQIDQIESGCERCRERLPRTYVFRDDFIREIAVIGRKIDLVFSELTDLRKDLTTDLAKETDHDDGS